MAAAPEDIRTGISTTLEEQATQIKKMLLECHVMRTRSKKYERPVGGSSLGGFSEFNTYGGGLTFKQQDSKMFQTLDSNIY